MEVRLHSRFQTELYLCLPIVIGNGKCIAKYWIGPVVGITYMKQGFKFRTDEQTQYVMVVLFSIYYKYIAATCRLRIITILEVITRLQGP